MFIKNVEIKGFTALAPMAGVADRAVREISVLHGAAYTVGEMTSAKGVAMGSEKSAELLTPDPQRPFAVQLFGTDPDCLQLAAERAAILLPDIIDINMGCPAPKITGGGAGSALLKNLPLASEIIKAVIRGANDIPVTVKIRKGFEYGEDVAVEAALMAEDAGAAAVTIHARTRAQMYSPPIDIHCITRVKQALSIPVIGNGDIFCAQDAVDMFNITGCDLVMIGRGALGNPWIFSQIESAMRGETPPPMPTLSQKLDMLRQEIELLVLYKGEHTGFLEARKHTSWYMTGLNGAAKLRAMCGALKNWEDIQAILKQVLILNEN